MFSIRRLPPTVRGIDGEQLGEVTVGDFVERFAIWPSSAPDWKAELQRLIDGAPVVALIHDPRFAWVVYREGDACFVQQRLSLDGRFDGLLPRKTVMEDGDPISEWATSIEEISNFVCA
jgi:CdiI N-terminal domain